jgi:hypothetical protein
MPNRDTSPIDGLRKHAIWCRTYDHLPCNCWIEGHGEEFPLTHGVRAKTKTVTIASISDPYDEHDVLAFVAVALAERGVAAPCVKCTRWHLTPHSSWEDVTDIEAEVSRRDG